MFQLLARPASTSKSRWAAKADIMSAKMEAADFTRPILIADRARRETVDIMTTTGAVKPIQSWTATFFGVTDGERETLLTV